MEKPLSFNIYHPKCPSRLFFSNLADKWVLFIVDSLQNQPTHFNALKKIIEGISPKVLSQKLKMLERDGFIQRQVLDTRPVKIMYSLSPLGHELAKTALAFKLWAESHAQQVLDAQKKYDAAIKEKLNT
ncbi:winged helix-turn-helix transcriptional regulator [Acinetobacter rudis]|uniref:Helix-turn-helix domain-containing protein n=1 Tax=Acinetobacter rudis TaxID=632955 RepID=A0AAW8J3H7_9GAMM|nr:helix-turn-helix domain-containing protein [Acinetobacter rudis]MDQ8934572.1 helix-turn-helix domain-containing protein [Acinetobacter rudis]MDQ8951661.1 helix-turn-helix domain-containing protein [Acinetobacter rudis]MDQ9016858.1 helix-turn-helix domain-containing protein [Acinetobacter rudis]